MDHADALIERINHLPSLSPVLARINAIVGSPEVSAGDMVDALKLDPAISGKVLRLANSAYVGIPRTVSSLHNAVVILGQRRIHSLVLAASTLSAFPRSSAFPFQILAFWRHSITVAIVSESIARHLKRYGAVEEGELFCAGILHDIGKLAVAAFEPKRVTAAQETGRQKEIPFFQAEEESMSHYTLGALLAQRWNFPPDLRNAILYHHDPSSAEPFTKMAVIVHLSDVMAHLMGFRTLPDEIPPTLDEAAIARIELQPERLRVIANTAVEDEKRLESLIEFIA